MPILQLFMSVEVNTLYIPSFTNNLKEEQTITNMKKFLPMQGLSPMWRQENQYQIITGSY